MTTLYIIRGIPGSGKSTYARSLGLKHHYEADAYMERNGGYTKNPDGSIKFNPEFLKKAHDWCQNMTRKALMEGNDVVVSNTFTRKWELKPYLEMAKDVGANVVEKVMTGRWPNVHGCPEEKVKKMEESFEP